jgi:hypothetical protein
MRYRTIFIVSGGIFLLLLVATVFTLSVRSRFVGCALSESGVEDVRLLALVLGSYALEYRSYPASLDALGLPPPGSAADAVHTGWIDAQLAAGKKVGYVFRYIPKWSSAHLELVTSYILTADPIGGGLGHHYFSDETAVVRAEEDRPATADSRETHDSSCSCAAKENYVGARN